MLWQQTGTTLDPQSWENALILINVSDQLTIYFPLYSTPFSPIPVKMTFTHTLRVPSLIFLPGLVTFWSVSYFQSRNRFFEIKYHHQKLTKLTESDIMRAIAQQTGIVIHMIRKKLKLLNTILGAFICICLFTLSNILLFQVFFRASQ